MVHVRLHALILSTASSAPDERGGTGWPRSPPRKVTYFEPVPPRLASNTIIESTFEVGRRFRCKLRVDCGQLDPGAVIRPTLSEWHPRMLERLDDEERADWRAGREAAYHLAALTVVGAWQSPMDKRRQRKPGGGAGVSEGTIGIWGDFDRHIG